VIAGAAREIALAFGVPPLLLGLPGDNTFSNYAEANRAFWRQTVLPLVARVQKSFQAWLRPGFGSFRLDYNADRLEALASERAAEWERVGKAFLTLDEQREALGYGPAPKEALVAKRDASLERRYSPDQPRVPAGNSGGGQWTSGGGGGDSAGRSRGARDDRARRRDVEDRVRTATNIDPSVASDVDGSITLAQARGDRGRGGGGGDLSSEVAFAVDPNVSIEAGFGDNIQRTAEEPLIDLRDEERGSHGGHAITDHVGKTDNQLRDRIRNSYEEHWGGWAESDTRAGSFPSIEAANKLINSVLAKNASAVEEVISGRVTRSVLLKSSFDSPTGREAYVLTPWKRNAPVFFRNTRGAAVLITQDKKAKKGYSIITAFPVFE